MKRVFLVLPFLMSFLAHCFGQTPTPENGLNELQGLWRLKQIQVHVDKANPGQAFSESKLEWSVKGNKVKWAAPGHKDKEEAISVRVGKHSNLIDMTNTPTDFDGNPIPGVASQKLYGIYQVDRKVLKVCLPITPTGSNLRPVEMTGKEGSGCMVWIFEKVEAEK